jgi:hypothetical protein
MRIHSARHPAQLPSHDVLNKAELARDYKKGFDSAPGYKQLADPEKDKSLKGTKALSLYKATLGEGRSLDLVTDGDHLVYRGRGGQVCVLTFPEDADRGDGLWVFDKTGQKLLAQGVAKEGHLRWTK